MTKIQFELDGKQVEADAGETIWQVAKRQGREIPHLCYSPAPDYRPDGNCRACMVEIEGERVLAASCKRTPSVGMKVKTESARAVAAQKMVMELLVADQPARETSHDPDSKFWHWAEKIEVTESRFPAAERWAGDVSHPAMSVNLDACIQCGLCVRACREVQVNDVIGMAYRSHGSKIVFDFDDPMGESTCVACGECVQACPTGALMPSVMLDENQTRVTYADKKVDSLCPFCGVGCQVTYQVKDEKVIYAEGRDGPANHNRLCVKGRFGFDYIHHPHRLTKPLVRLPNAKKDANDQVDPANPFTHFREASWEEALDIAAKGLVKIRDEKGVKALAGFGSAKGLERRGLSVPEAGAHRLRLQQCRSLHAAVPRLVGGGADGRPEFRRGVGAVCGRHGCRSHHRDRRQSDREPSGGGDLHQERGQARRQADRDGSAAADAVAPCHQHLQFKPGSDVAMLNAMLHTIITEGLTDQQYIAGYTEGFDDLAEKIKEFPPEKMEPICGIPAETLREVARMYARSRASMIFWGMGISQHIHGTDNARCLIALALITGQVGRPGTGLHPLRGQNNVQGASDAGLIPMFLPDYQPVGRTDLREPFEKLWHQDLDPVRGLTVVEIMNAIHAGEITGMYIEGENPAMSDPDLQHAREALAKLDHLVVQDLFVTETAFHADVILPASAFAEKSGTFTNTDRRVQLAREVIKPPGDARQDLWIIQEIGKRMGLPWNYDGPADVFTEMTQVMPSLKNITWERLVREGAVTYPVDDPNKPGNEIIFTTGFPTASGRGKIVPAHVIAPDEVPDDEYPMVLSTGRVLEHWHTGSMTRRSSVLDQIEPEAVAFMSPKDMRRMSVWPGDFIRLETRRGAVEVKVRSDRDVPENMVFMPFCYAEAAANLLTNPALDPFGKIPEFKFCAVRAEKAELRTRGGIGSNASRRLYARLSGSRRSQPRPAARPCFARQSLRAAQYFPAGAGWSGPGSNSRIAGSESRSRAACRK